ncbi:MAG: tRNA pseudouridine(55) synthase TruB [Deltaproteobacteria bacterium]|nr:tRNA pseudouridine(55) synthase TruB [Deltaproteobacteria bacterium]
MNINKPKDITSFGVVSSLKKKLNVKKIGHAGTLDPMATGVLLVCLGEATKLVPYLMDLKKEYGALMKLGEETTTEDRTGVVTKTQDYFRLTETDIRKVFRVFRGESEQRPPLFSALKYKGKPLYKYARDGIEISPSTRKITVYKLEILDISLPFVRFRVECSKGTYIRSLCRDIGNVLGVGAHLFELERTSIGTFHVDKSISLEDIENKKIQVYGMNEALEHISNVSIKKESIQKILNGIHPKKEDLKLSGIPRFKEGGLVKLVSGEDKVLAMARVQKGPIFQLLRVFPVSF